MVQKLIRLTSNSGDGIFNGVFNEEITIKENSEIALQSLSVERESQEIVINGDNGGMTFSSYDDFPLQVTDIIPQGVYNRDNYKDLLENIGNAMNRVCNCIPAGSVTREQWGIQHKVDVSKSGNIIFESLVSPFYQIQKYFDADNDEKQMSFVVNDRSRLSFTSGAEEVNVWEEFQTDEYGMWRENDTTTGGGGAEPLITESYVYGTIPCIKSTGIFRTRFKRLNTDGAGTPSFTMGLVKGDEGLSRLQNAGFTLADCVYAIRVNGHNASMEYLREKGGEWITTVTPVNHTLVDSADGLNDVIDINFLNGTVQGSITSQTAGVPTRTELASALGHDVGEDYYWFISLHEGKDNLVLDLTGVTLDPFGVGEGASILPDNQFNFLPSDDSQIVDLPKWIRDNNIRNYQSSVQLSDDLAKYLGFKDSSLSPLVRYPTVTVDWVDEENDSDEEAKQVIGYFFEAQRPFDNSYDSDTYIIDTQSFTLDSFDSFGLRSVERNANSGGSRRNIIATVPITEVPIVGSSNSLIQYEPNTLYYVAIKNRGDVVTRQIRCRLLTGQYNSVETQGLASMVLLIRDPQ